MSKRTPIGLSSLAALILVLSPLARAGDVFNGNRIYTNHCAGCHGATGVSEVGNAPDFSRGEGLIQSDVSLMEQIARGARAMPGYRGVLSDEEMLDVISYIRTLF